MKKVRRSKDSKVVLKQKEKRFSRKTVWGIILAAIMVLSGAGFYFGSSSSENTFYYNGFKFTQDLQNGGQIVLHLKNKNVQFYDTPQNALQVEVDNNTLTALKNTIQWYLTFDPNSDSLQTIDLVRFDLTKTLAEDFSITLGNGILTNMTNATAYANYPIVTCANATRYVPVIVLEYMGNKTAITSNSTTCIIASAAQSSDMVQIRDRIVYSLYGVLP